MTSRIVANVPTAPSTVIPRAGSVGPENYNRVAVRAGDCSRFINHVSAHYRRIRPVIRDGWIETVIYQKITFMSFQA